MIDEGERHPLRLIKRLEAHESRFKLGWNGEATDDHVYCEDLAENTALLRCGTPAFRIAALRGNHMSVPLHTSACLHNFIIDFIGRHSPFNAIVELGCGYGRTIFELWYGGAPSAIPFFGGELTATEFIWQRSWRSWKTASARSFSALTISSPTCVFCRDMKKS
jgi:hypothetical protein